MKTAITGRASAAAGDAVADAGTGEEGDATDGPQDTAETNGAVSGNDDVDTGDEGGAGEDAQLLTVEDAPVLLSYSRGDSLADSFADISSDVSADDDEETWDAEATEEGAYREVSEEAEASEDDETSDTVSDDEREADEEPAIEMAETDERPGEPARRGWWQRR